MKPNQRNLVLIAILALALGLRLFNLGAGDLTTDEAKTALGVAFPHSFLLPQISVISQKIFGFNEMAARLPFALLGTGAVWLMFIFGRLVKDDKFGLLTAGLLAVLPGNVILSRSAYLDISLVFIWLLLLIAWLIWERQKSLAGWLTLFLIILIAPFLKIQAVYLFFVLFLYLVYQRRGRFWRDERFWLMAVGWLPFLFYFLSQPQQLYDMKSYITKQIGDASSLVSFLSNLWQANGILLVASLGGLGFFVWRAGIKKQVQSDADKLMGGFFLLIGLILFFTPNNLYYYVMPDMAVVYFSAYFITSFKKRTRLVLLTAVCLIINLGLIFTNPNINFACSNDSLGYFWQNNQREINSLISNGRPVFLDTGLGFTGKWYILQTTYKTDYFVNWRKKNPLAPAWLVLTKTNYEENYRQFEVWRDYESVKIIKVLPALK
ncbi:MAG: hypothetical protein COU31_00430 [Candidatus Magasanikbacteria bacterium CG10_big_fil_rev_8_21_14_0_10_40_10]|uniref:Glycosyltransferase RgtA/B/C/D-like domain-containing protein n=1 Tax=Candidatus Magasanikbacteria bacterium CG10_big_fil_rev_8_21_14_0_10_40_10 TaxID=1974648 RepID=A0A2M6W557_9BACT|nr:MAG: hypothetical protein COU31_00430 [Candidatus Magasanikbacteria bacterium CG10_big_fil_rev_8_21_14_0_10_40_10]